MPDFSNQDIFNVSSLFYTSLKLKNPTNAGTSRNVWTANNMTTPEDTAPTFLAVLNEVKTIILLHILYQNTLLQFILWAEATTRPTTKVALSTKTFKINTTILSSLKTSINNTSNVSIHNTILSQATYPPLHLKKTLLHDFTSTQ